MHEFEEEDLVQGYYVSVAWFIRSRVPGLSHEEVEELAQEVLLAFLQKIDRLCNPDRARKYVYGIAQNKCADVLRLRSRQSPTERLDEQLIDANALDPSDIAAGFELRRKTREHLERHVPEPYRSGIILRCRDELSWGEAAAITGVHPDTLRLRARRWYMRLLFDSA